MIYLAPLQGFTDFVYRNAYQKVFHSVDAFYIPYITTKALQIERKYEKEILRDNNPLDKVIPQLMVKDTEELIVLMSKLCKFGYREVNLNLGCPYPMVTGRGKGAALLAEPGKLKALLEYFFAHYKIELSVKMRAGFEALTDIESIIPVLNQFPVKEVIVHPRLAKQMYKGAVHYSAFQYAIKHLKEVPVYNGDIFSFADYQDRSGRFPQVKNWMLGRGVLMNVFLPDQMKGHVFSDDEKRRLLADFHALMVESYIGLADNPGNALNKLQQFWGYFSFHFEKQQRVLKLIKKTKDIQFMDSGVRKLIWYEELRKQN